MRTRTVIYAKEPAGSSGLRALRRQLSLRGADAPPDILGPVNALCELEAVCAGMLAGRGGPYPANRGSLIDDLQTALRELGPKTRAAMGTQLTDFQSELSKLMVRLDTSQGARVTALSLGRLSERLSEEAVVAAAWWDTADAFLDDDKSAERCELRLAQLVELAEHRGVDYARWASTAEWVIGDEAHILQQLGENLGVKEGAGPQFAGVDEKRRLEICERTLAELPPRSGVAAWLVIDNAALPDDMSLAVGPVWLFDARYWSEEYSAGDLTKRLVAGFDEPPELADWGPAQNAFKKLHASEHRILARIWLENTTVESARTQARKVLQNLIDLARSDSDWLVLEGEAAWRETGGWSVDEFVDPAAAAEADRRHPAHEWTAERLKTFDGEFVKRLLGGDASAAEPVEDALWWVAVKRAPAPSQRIMLAIRAVERTLGQAREKPTDSWAEAARRYLRAPWVDRELQDELYDAGYCALSALPDKHGTNAELAAGLQAAVFPAAAKPWTSFVREFGALAPTALDKLQVGSIEHRLVRDAVSVVTSPQAARNRLRELGRRFDRLLARTERQRNALTHGTGTTDAVVAGVDDFVAVLAAYVAHEALKQAEGGDEPLVDLEQDRVRALERDARLEVRVSPPDVLWPED